ncbi:MAG: hypothetical protein M3Q71_10980 [Chloroflexota bacterium]|nr:hypothetical protein [Chloroflexota bacterium]
MTEHDPWPAVTADNVMEVSAFLQRIMAEAGALAVDASVPREVRLELALGLVRLREQLRRAIPDVTEGMIRLAYGDPGPYQTEPVPPEIQEEAARELIERGIVTRAELDTLPMEALISRVRERLAGQGVVDDTGLVG